MAEVTPPVVPPPVTPPAAPDWTAGFSDDTKGFVQNKGYKGPQDVIDSYRGLEKLLGVPPERIIKLPESMDQPEARAVWERLGTPKEAKDYGLDANLATDFLEIGVPKEMAAKIVAKQAERQKLADAANVENQKTLLANADLALKKEWGMAYDQNRAIVDASARNLGLKEEEVASLGQVLGMDKAMKLLHGLGVKTGEHSFVTGQQVSSSVLSPEQARQRKAELMKDNGFVTKLYSGDVEARKTWDRVHQQMSPE